MAAELECYVLLADESAAAIDAFWQPVDAAFRAASLPIVRIEKERGLHQYEVVTGVMPPAQLVQVLEQVRSILGDQAAQSGVVVDFRAKPFVGQPSSGMHIHLHLADAHGVNSYHKTEEWTSDTLRWSLGGLLAALPAQMPIFFPTAEDLARLEDVDHVPKIYGWGVNNRYCALRIPAVPDPFDKRIEHRVPCANAAPEAVVNAVLEGVLEGLRGKVEPPPQHHGKTGRGLVVEKQN